MNNLKTRTIWLIFFIELLVAIGLLFGAIYAPKKINTFLIILIGIDFVLITFTIQYATYKSFRAKAIKRSYKEKNYKSELDLYDVLENNDFEIRNISYGKSYLKIIDDNAYKVTIITDPNAYFENNDDNKESKLAKKLNKCKRFMGLEIFFNISDELIDKIRDFTIQGEKVYYTALIKDLDNNYKCLNYEAPSENHKLNFEVLYNLLGLKESE